MHEVAPELLVDLGLIAFAGVLLYLIGSKVLTIKDFMANVRKRSKKRYEQL